MESFGPNYRRSSKHPSQVYNILGNSVMSLMGSILSMLHFIVNRLYLL